MLTFLIEFQFEIVYHSTYEYIQRHKVIAVRVATNYYPFN